jgi:DNA-binding response OmpR family regulator
MSQHDSKRVLYVGRSDREYGQLAEILSGSLWSLERALNCAEARAALDGDAVGVVLAESRLDDGEWERLVESGSGSKPNLIVCSGLGVDCERTRVLARGGFGILEMPFDENEVMRTLDVAEWDWNRRRGLGLAASA